MTMILHCAVLLLFLNVARTSDVHTGLSNFVSDVDSRYSLWPSIHTGVRLMRIRKREAETPQTTKNPDGRPDAVVSGKVEGQGGQSKGQSVAQPSENLPSQNSQNAGPLGHSEGQSVGQPVAPPIQSTQPSSAPQQPVKPAVSTQDLVAPNNAKENKKEEEKPSVLDNNTVHKSQNVTANETSSITDDKSKLNTTATEPPKMNLSDPGVMKRAFIVFGGFALLATAYYFIIYRKKGSSNDAKNAHSSIDPNQFRYGVLESEDKRSSMELSRVPLTMESDQDEDDDLEIFDLGQKKKSLSYINLQQHDEDIVLNDSRSIDMENILVDIEDKNTDTLINWSSSGSKSIL